jgi:hypothetical protein
MSTSNSTLQKPDAQFLAFANGMNNQCHQNMTAWEITQHQMDIFDLRLANANASYAANNDPNTKNATTAANKKADFGELKNFLGMFINSVEGNDAVPDAALEHMGLRPRHQHVHQPLPRPTTSPVISVVKLHNEITVYAAQPEHDHPTASVAPVHYNGFLLHYKVEGQEGFREVTSTRLHHTLFFEPEEEGKRILLKAAWVNHRMETGPWSNEISEIIG